LLSLDCDGCRDPNDVTLIIDLCGIGVDCQCDVIWRMGDYFTVAVTMEEDYIGGFSGNGDNWGRDLWMHDVDCVGVEQK